MTPDEFWYGDPELYFNYEWAFREKIKQKDIDIWSIGVRVFEVLQSSPIVAGLATKEVVNNMRKYPKCPHQDEVHDSYSDEDIENLRLREEIELTNWVNSFKKRK